MLRIEQFDTPDSVEVSVDDAWRLLKARVVSRIYDGMTEGYWVQRPYTLDDVRRFLALPAGVTSETVAREPVLVSVDLLAFAKTLDVVEGLLGPKAWANVERLFAARASARAEEERRWSTIDQNFR